MNDAGDGLLARDHARVWHPYTQHGLERDFLPVVGARGALLTLADGRVLIDGIASWWACAFGHGHPRLLEAMRAQAEQLDHVLFAGATHEPAVALAEELVALAPRGLTRVFYSDDGSTAVEVALKMVRQLWVARGEPERRVFVCLQGGYHGDTFGAMAVGDPEPFFRPFTPLLFAVRRVAPVAGAVGAALEELGSQAAGVIVEPLLQGAGGMRMHGEPLVRDVRAACDAHDVPLIADEVLTGMGRTGGGELFACARAGVTPDVLCTAKALTGGLFPLAATLATEEVFGAFLSTERGRAFFHGHTYTAHPIGCAVARAALELAVRERVSERLDAIGERILSGLAELEGDPRVVDLRRVGGVVAFDLATSEPGYLAPPAPRLREEAARRGVLLRPLGNVVYALPPACLDEAQCDRVAEVMVELARSAN